MTLTHDVIHQLFGADDAELNALLALIDAANQGGQSATRIPANLVINRPNLSALIAIEYDALGPIAGYQRDAVDERQIATLLAKRCSLPADINRAQPAQLAAVQLACTQTLTLLTGGPGTGKTYTLGKIIEALSANGRLGRLAVAAPTGKAANRLAQSFANLSLDVKSSTLHRLLGIAEFSAPKFNAENYLPFDTVIIDECSMLSNTRMRQLLEALPPNARLVLCGDANQLPPIEIGAPWRSISIAKQLSPWRIELQTRHRFNEDIGQLADAILSGNDAFPLSPNTKFNPDLTARFADLLANCRQLVDNPTDQSSFRLLCAHRNGPNGSQALNQYISQQLNPRGGWFEGQPIIINQNAPSKGLFNGDVGWLTQINGQWCAKFADSIEDENFPVYQLPQFETAFALTVHRTQGSEFRNVWVNLIGADVRLINREMLYTAITRAKAIVELFAHPTEYAQCVQNQSPHTDFLSQFLEYMSAQPNSIS